MEKELAEMNKPTHKGRAVKVVKSRSCTNCIFWKPCLQGVESESFEKKNDLEPCYLSKVKYIYA